MTEFIARAKEHRTAWTDAETGKKVYGNDWVVGEVLTKKNTDEALIHIGDTYPTFHKVDKETICWQCPETPYFEGDVLKLTEEDGDVTIAEVYFCEGCFVVDVPFGDYSSIAVPTLEDHGFKVELLGNTIDNPELTPNP